MNELLPLEVFYGWETPDQVSPITYLMLCLLGPLAFGLVVTIIVWTPRLMGQGRQEATSAGLIDGNDAEAHRLASESRPQIAATATSARRGLES